MNGHLEGLRSKYPDRNRMLCTFEAPARTSTSVWNKDTMVTVSVRNHTNQVDIKNLEAIGETEERWQETVMYHKSSQRLKYKYIVQVHMITDYDYTYSEFI